MTVTVGEETRKGFPLRTAGWEKPKLLSLTQAEFPAAVGFLEGLVPSAGPGPGPGGARRSRPGEFLREECGRVSRAGGERLPARQPGFRQRFDSTTASPTAGEHEPILGLTLPPSAPPSSSPEARGIDKL